MIIEYVILVGVSEILKQVWDLSDQDNDSMLSLKEFCIALYLMERFREGRPLPTMLPSTIVPEDALFSLPGQPAVPHGSAAWGHVGGIVFLTVSQSFDVVATLSPFY